MEVKAKKCKGTGKAVDFGCGTMQLKRIYGLGVSCKCYQNWLLNSDAGREKIKKETLKISQPRIAMEKAIEENKHRVKLSYLLTNTKNICHEYVRLRDGGKPCISCGTPYKEDFQAGHFYKAELFSNLKFDEKNISGQCRQCNLRKEGNESGYRVGIIQRYNEDHLKYLDDKAKHYKQNHFEWDKLELFEVREYYKEKLKELKNPLK